ncbi:MAG: DUF1707 domain-containing protein [Chloroflexi bacterium]|nr:DUF1707 domain-containing protein [Chloroflexota bacterium]
MDDHPGFPDPAQSHVPRPQRDRAALRASDADREQTAALLREHFSQGRLTIDEFQERLEQAYAARTFGDLDSLTLDLPAAPLSPARVAAPPGRGPARWDQQRRLLIRYLLISLFFIVVWALTGSSYFWPIWIILIMGLFTAFQVFDVPRSRGRRERRRSRHER